MDEDEIDAPTRRTAVLATAGITAITVIYVFVGFDPTLADRASSRWVLGVVGVLAIVGLVVFGYVRPMLTARKRVAAEDLR